MLTLNSKERAIVREAAKQVAERADRFNQLTEELMKSFEWREKACSEFRLCWSRLNDFREGDQKNMTARELQVLDLLSAGRSNKDIATRLNISVSTAKFHVTQLLRKLGVRKRRELLNR